MGALDEAAERFAAAQEAYDAASDARHGAHEVHTAAMQAETLAHRALVQATIDLTDAAKLRPEVRV